ncbi:hypothetical protein [Natrononativus amylolyticus]|uniref:hypothetical protein n=1 Tax=Natrononativus amylolyticus TaxID=2963434 RepID=UPI0020CDF933|nr:hypothetical protein [Natrononativus amylolyticus]
MDPSRTADRDDADASGTPRERPLATRRAVLALVAAAPVALAGCPTEYDEGYEERPEPVEEHIPVDGVRPDLPVREFADEYERGIESGLDAPVDDSASFGTALESAGLDVDRLERDDPYLYLAYVASPPENGVLRGVGFVAGAYAQYVLATDDPPTLDATVLETQDVDFGTFTAYVNWVRALEAGEESVAVYGERVFATLKTKR